MMQHILTNLLVLSTVLNQNAAAVSHFGFYYPDANVASVSQYSTCAFVDNNWVSGGGKASLDIAALEELKTNNLTAVLASIYSVVFDEKDPTQQKLKANYTEEWAVYWSAIKPYADMITAFYPVDEPSPTVIASGAYKSVVTLLKKTAPNIPILAVVTASAVKGIEYSAYDLPAEVDWIGYDEYGCWAETECEEYGECCWENRTIPHNLGILNNYVRNRSGSMVVVPDGVAMFPPGATNMTPSAVDQQRRAARDELFYQYCQNTSVCVAYLPFLYRTIKTASVVLVGVGDQTILVETLAKIGAEIKTKKGARNV